ncbi:hypothetical protein BLNAU_5678 [Blattamonas nauphoetae]|uniref:Uncharacterized protein n=1 Tax=Blattamonas nauphoetae TaxID=2049346 RepID=A0ABQ9Y6Q2_9EUKA|nr:hypothetical protein BLNAU_5678 [Blattamonas nauphoetae]
MEATTLPGKQDNNIADIVANLFTEIESLNQSFIDHEITLPEFHSTLKIMQERTTTIISTLGNTVQQIKKKLQEITQIRQTVKDSLATEPDNAQLQDLDKTAQLMIIQHTNELDRIRESEHDLGKLKTRLADQLEHTELVLKEDKGSPETESKTAKDDSRPTVASPILVQAPPEEPPESPEPESDELVALRKKIAVLEERISHYDEAKRIFEREIISLQELITEGKNRETRLNNVINSLLLLQEQDTSPSPLLTFAAEVPVPS